MNTKKRILIIDDDVQIGNMEQELPEQAMVMNSYGLQLNLKNFNYEEVNDAEN